MQRVDRIFLPPVECKLEGLDPLQLQEAEPAVGVAERRLPDGSVAELADGA
jgi:hypothetical protein